MILAIQLLAIIIAVCGTWLLQTAWKKADRHWGLVISSWALIGLSFYIWTFTSAADKGVALGIVAWVLVMLIVLLATVLSSPSRVERRLNKSQNRSEPLSIKLISKQFISALLIGPLSGIVALGGSVSLFQLMLFLDFEYTANLAIALMLFPILWGGIAVLLAYQSTIVKRALSLLGFGVGSAFCIFLV